MFTDGIAFLLVAWAAGFLALHFFRKYLVPVLAPGLAAFFLRRGRVGWAMRLRPGAARKACGGRCDCK